MHLLTLEIAIAAHGVISKVRVKSYVIYRVSRAYDARRRPFLTKGACRLCFHDLSWIERRPSFAPLR
jgi:hypothetical protein